MKGIIGRKLGMTQIYDSNGQVRPVTVVEAGPCTVLALRKQGQHGYSALQLGFGARKAKNVTKPMRGHVKAAGLADTPPAEIAEIRLSEDPQQNVGDKVLCNIFAENDFVDVVGTTIGRGFQGVVRRHRFAGGRASHGGGWTRRGGSSGCKARPGKVHKNKRMAGHMGVVRCKVQNLQIVKVRAEENLLLIQGSLPGPTGGTVVVCSAVKK